MKIPQLLIVLFVLCLFSTVSVTAQIIVNFSTTDATCNGSCDGTATAMATGGMSPYTFLWNSGATTSTITGLCAGFYITTVTDNLGAADSFGVSIFEPPALVVTLTVSNATAGNCDGSIASSVSGGTAPYTYLWDDPFAQTTATAVTLCAANYSFYVTDANGCTNIGTATVVEDSLCLTTASISTVAATCGLCDGTATVTATGGTAPYTYTWDDPALQSNATAVGLCPGVFTVYISDFTGCTVSYAATISNSISFSVIVTSTDASCNSAADGTASVMVVGGVPPYSYMWNDPGTQTDSIAVGLFAGVYVVTVIDANSCQVNVPVTISEPPAILTTVTTTPSSCGAADGTATVTATGGAPPYNYGWSTGDSTATTTGQLAGPVTVTVTDSTSCSVTDSSTSIVDSCGNISGRVFDDINGDGVQDVGENGLAGLVITLTPGPIVSFTDQNGNYSINLSNFTTYTVETFLPWQVYYCSGSMILSSTLSLPASPGTYTVVIDNVNPVSTGNDFGIVPPAVPCGTISGHVWEDLNENGIEDLGEVPMPGANISVNWSMAQTDGNGDYNIDVPLNATYVVSMNSGGGNFNYYCYGSQVTTSGQTFPTSPGDYTVTPTTGTPDVGGLDFGMSTAPVVDAGIYSLWPNAGVIPGNDFGGGMDFKIWDGSTTTCTLRLDFDPWVTFISASITPDVIGANYVEWVFVNPSNYFGMCMFYTFNLSSSAPPGTALNWFASLSCDAPDACPQNDTRSATTYVANPNKSWKVNLNKMAVFHTGDTITGEITTADSTFSYEIGYMNLGTDTIFNMMIRDTLPDFLDVKSISKPFSMHESIMDMDIIDTNVIVFTFKGINLTDTATNYASSYGFLQFNIRMKRNLPIGTVIENTASIFFDYADPIFTDTVSNTIVQSNSIANSPDQLFEISVHPNPFSNSTAFELHGADTFKGLSLELFDLLGKRVKVVQNITGPRFELDRVGLLSGIYFYKLNTEHRELGSGKVIID
ncbi:MAG: T9SS type A sorting domain-containing protein [Flavobacteriales bacterium]|nr:T9SS type A sorting domain-containing protein [Flavobacteriales bacterium]